MKKPARLTQAEVAEKFTPEEISAIERKVQLEGATNPDGVRLPDGRTVTEARLDIEDAVSLKLRGVSIYEEDAPAAAGVITGDAPAAAEDAPAAEEAPAEDAGEAATTSRRTRR